ncbi:hypothetical protein [Altericroceibacterium xinjiangense]|uniref:hypothetical protein n=1 Tax=Altericroceibacterium xinjiangense TaxID=762261 RepID=UPI000F7FA915|nr:hypothetical protein [Altericroceibacterium xinjiangense]
MQIKTLIAASFAASLAACAATPGYDAAPGMAGSNYVVAETGNAVPATAIAPYSNWANELRGRTVRIDAQGGVTNLVNFAPDGTMRIQVVPGQPPVQGYWGLRNNMLCVNFAPRGEECWPYQGAMVANQPVRVTSNRGQDLVVTMVQ